MSKQRLGRRALLRATMVGAVGVIAAACQPKVVEVEKVIKETVEVEKIVEKEVPVAIEKEVTRVVEPVAAPRERVVVQVVSCEDMVGWEACFQAFNATHEWVTAEAVRGTRDEFRIALATGTVPDLKRVDAMAADTFLRGGAFCSLQPYVDREGYDFDWMYDVARPWIRYPLGGEVYYMPHIGGAFLCYYNKDHFDEEGLDYPSDDWDWTDYAETAAKLTKVDSSGRPLRFGSFNWPDMWWNSWLIPLFQAGGVPWRHPDWHEGGFTDPDFIGPADQAFPGYSTEALKQGLRFIHELIYQYQCCPRPGFELPPGMGFLTGNESMAFGDAGYAAWCIESDKVANWGVVQVPKAPTERGRHGSQAYVCGFCMADNCQHKDAAWEVCKYLYSQECRKCAFLTGKKWGWPQDLEEWIASRPGMDASYQNLFQYMQGNDAIFMTRVSEYDRFLNQAVDPWRQKVILDEVDIDEAVSNMIKDGTAVLAEGV